MPKALPVRRAERGACRLVRKYTVGPDRWFQGDLMLPPCLTLLARVLAVASRAQRLNQPCIRNLAEFVHFLPGWQPIR